MPRHQGGQAGGGRWGGCDPGALCFPEAPALQPAATRLVPALPSLGVCWLCLTFAPNGKRLHLQGCEVWRAQEEAPTLSPHGL